MSKFNLREKLLKSIMNSLFPKLENICDIFGKSDISVSESVGKTHTNTFMGNSLKNKFVFSIVPTKKTQREISITIDTGGTYTSIRILSLNEFSEKSGLDCETLIVMSNLFMEKIKTFSEKENEINKTIDEINKLEIIYKKELLLEKIKREISKPKKTRAIRVQQNNDFIDIGDCEYVWDEVVYNNIPEGRVTQDVNMTDFMRIAQLIGGNGSINKIIR